MSGDAESNLETKKSSVLGVRLSWLRVIRAYTHSSKQQSFIVLGSDTTCLFENIPHEAPRHVSWRPD